MHLPTHPLPFATFYFWFQIERGKLISKTLNPSTFRLIAKYIDGDDNFDGTDGDDDSDDVQEGWWAMVPCGNSTLKT